MTARVFTPAERFGADVGLNLIDEAPLLLAWVEGERRTEAESEVAE